MRIWVLDACLKVETTFGHTDNKRVLGTIITVNMFGISKLMLGCSVANKTVFSSAVEVTIVLIFIKLCIFKHLLLRLYNKRFFMHEG